MSKHEDETTLGGISGLTQYMRRLEVADRRIILATVFLLMFGLIMVYSASSAQYGLSMLRKQAFIGAAGFAGMLIMSYVDYHRWIKWAGALYIVAFISLFLVMIRGLGVSKNGANRWIEIRGISVQPSEFMKPVIVIVLAYMMVEMGRNLAGLRGIIVSMLPAIAAVGVIYKVTDNLSTALIVMGIAVVMFFVAYPDKRIWILVGVTVAAAGIFAYYYYQHVVVPSHYAQDAENFRAGRILAWLYPDEYSELSMQSRYSLYAIGFGGLLGRGLGSGTMKYYIPEASNDFIFAVIGEELGLVGCAMVIFMFVYLVWRIVKIARHANDKIGGMMAAGIAAHIALQVILNIGVSTRVLPNTGISLPMISYGGTALLIQMMEIGLVLNISRQIPGRRMAAEGSTQGRKENRRVRSA